MAPTLASRLPRSLRLMLIGLALSSFLVWNASPARAAGAVGDGTAASCTEQALRSAIAAGGAVRFNCGPNPVTIPIASEIVIKKNVEIDGGGTITLSGGGRTRLFRIYTITGAFRNLTMRDGYGDGGAAMSISHFSTITIANVKFLNNNGTRIDSSNGGGALHVRHSVITIQDSLFEGNVGINGGAINNLGNTLYIIRTTFRNNDSTPGGIASGTRSGSFGFGGAIYIDGARHRDTQSAGGVIDIRDSQFVGNKARQQGGAIYSFVYAPDSVRISGTLFEGNRVDPASRDTKSSGGGVRHGNGPLTITGSAFINNVATSEGGGLWTGYPYPGSITNSTFAGNRIEGADGRGGGLFIADGPYTLVNTTIADNYAGLLGGGLSAKPASAALRNTLIAGNRVGGARPETGQCHYTLSSQSNSLQSPAPAGATELPCASGIARQSPRVSAVGIYGGALPTVRLLDGSPAIDAGADCPPTDQRGAARVRACDIGAFEHGGVVPGSTPPAAPLLKGLQSDQSPVVRASWPAVEGATSYEVEINGGNLSSEATLLAVEESQFGMLLGRGSYTMRVRACNWSGCSAFSASASAVVSSDPLRLSLPLVVR